VAEANARSRKAINSVISTLDNIHVVANVDLDELAENYGTGLWRMNKEFVAATQAIAMVPEFTEASKERIAKEWATNLNLYYRGLGKRSHPRLAPEGGSKHHAWTACRKSGKNDSGNTRGFKDKSAFSGASRNQFACVKNA